MAKSKPIGVRFDLEKLEIIKKEQNLTSNQSVLDYLIDFYFSHIKSDKIILELDKMKTKVYKEMLKNEEKHIKHIKEKKVLEIPKNDPKEGSMAFVLKYGVSTYEELNNK